MEKKTPTTPKKNSNVAEEQSTTATQTTANLENHDPQASARTEAVILMQQSNENTVKMGATCADKRIHQGSAIIDKDTRQQKVNPQTNQPMFYANKYYAVLTFDGGQIETEITEEQHSLLSIGGRYSCYGRLAPVKVYGNEQIMPVFHSFTRLY